jgi:predicted nucleic acid-binding protein
LRSLLSIPKTAYSTELLPPAVLKLARALNTTVHDSLYLALAGLLLGCPLVTADPARPPFQTAEWRVSISTL